MKRYIVLLIVVFSFKCSSNCINFDQDQLRLYNKLSSVSAKVFGDKLLLPAISLIESGLDKYLFRINIDNPRDNSFGLAHASVYRHRKKDMTPFAVGMWVQRITSDEDFAIEVLVADLKYWLKVRGGDVRRSLSSYNSGSDWNQDYLDELTIFPDPGGHKDQVDATSGAFSYLVKRVIRVGAF
jgi:hypothetical protein